MPWPFTRLPPTPDTGNDDTRLEEIISRARGFAKPAFVASDQAAEGRLAPTGINPARKGRP